MKATDRSSSSARILPARTEHLESIAKLADATWRAYYPGIISHEQIDYMLHLMYDLKVLERELANGIRYDRLLSDDKLAGFASYGGADCNGEIKLHKLYMHPDFQRCGLGSLLLKHVENSARRLGFRSIILSVNKTNRQAIAAYQKNRFSIRESVVVDIGGGFVMDDFVMEKNLKRE